MIDKAGCIYTVNSRKFDGTIRRSWKCSFVLRDDEKIDLVGLFEHEVEHPALGTIEAGTLSSETFYFNRWYNCFIFEHPAGQLRNYYINICMPPVIGNRVIDYVDLDIDFIVWPDRRWETLDLEEFEENRLRFEYSDEILSKVNTTLRELEVVLCEAQDNHISDLVSLL